MWSNLPERSWNRERQTPAHSPTCFIAQMPRYDSAKLIERLVEFSRRPSLLSCSGAQRCRERSTAHCLLFFAEIAALLDQLNWHTAFSQHQRCHAAGQTGADHHDWLVFSRHCLERTTRILSALRVAQSDRVNADSALCDFYLYRQTLMHKSEHIECTAQLEKARNFVSNCFAKAQPATVRSTQRVILTAYIAVVLSESNVNSKIAPPCDWRVSGQTRAGTSSLRNVSYVVHCSNDNTIAKELTQSNALREQEREKRHGDPRSRVSRLRAAAAVVERSGDITGVIQLGQCQQIARFAADRPRADTIENVQLALESKRACAACQSCVEALQARRQRRQRVVMVMVVMVVMVVMRMRKKQDRLSRG